MRLLSAGISIGKSRSPGWPEFIWFIMAVSAVAAEIFHHSFNNYYIFKGVFWHVIHQTNLYIEYPSEYFDVNHYGPFFSIIIAPFAILPDVIGVFVWCILNAFVLWYAIKKLPVNKQGQLYILLIAAIEMMTSIHNVQINPMLAGWLILAFVLTNRGKDFWAALFIAAGFMVKLYGIAGLLFFVFSKHKLKFSLSVTFWICIMFLIPMFFSSPRFIIQSYMDWWHAIIQKNMQNTDLSRQSFMQDISFMGFIRRVFHIKAHFDFYVLFSATLMILLPLLRFRQYKFLLYRVSYLAIVLISIVIFSSSAESSTYIIAVMGVAIWYITYPSNNWSLAVLVFMLILTSLSPTDLFPAYLRNYYVGPYSLKAIPCIIVWFILLINIAFKNFFLIKSPTLINETDLLYSTGV